MHIEVLRRRLGIDVVVSRLHVVDNGQSVSHWMDALLLTVPEKYRMVTPPVKAPNVYCAVVFRRIFGMPPPTVSKFSVLGLPIFVKFSIARVPIDPQLDRARQRRIDTVEGETITRLHVHTPDRLAGQIEIALLRLEDDARRAVRAPRVRIPGEPIAQGRTAVLACSRSTAQARCWH